MGKQTATYQRLQSILIHSAFLGAPNEPCRQACPICTLCQQAVTTYLDTLLWESSNDLNLHDMLIASLGFCGRHSRELLTFGGQRLAVAVVERASLLAAIRRLPDLAAGDGPAPARFRLWPTRHGARPQAGKQGDLPPDIQPCPACERQANEAARGIDVLLAHLEEFADPLLANGGLCLPHFAQAARARDPVGRASLLAIEQRVLVGPHGKPGRVHPQAHGPPPHRVH